MSGAILNYLSCCFILGKYFSLFEWQSIIAPMAATVAGVYIVIDDKSGAVW
ncbi:hypothetical protein [Providencia stuartii]|uniref:hypothetical protein n=1 Tax=Providencia stuartii TaxID=588 RepID=UPI00131A07CA